jgi:transcriptional regulator with XRE-family HTH domain
MSRDAAVGRHLARLREAAGYKQNELARRIEWSPAVLSRIESGERPASGEELDALLSAVDTPEARAFAERLSRLWSIIPEPDFDEPDADLIWEAERAAQRVEALPAQRDVKHFFERRLTRYKEELCASAARLTNRRYRIVFAGAIGAGKSTAICRVESLELTGGKGMPVPVLEAGPGGITLCEVHVERGPGYGFLVEPCSDDEVRRHVLDFARSLLESPSEPSGADAADADGKSPGASREISRALRSMAELPLRRFPRRPDGTKPPSVDEGRILARQIGDLKALAVEILARMQLHRRDRRDLWHAASSKKEPLALLRDIFEQVNNGKHLEFSLPRRMEIIVPHALLREESLSVTLIDTQGIDDVAGRADLEQHFDDPHTVVVLCTRFEEAPSVHIRQLLTRAREAGVRTLSTHAGVLVLARPGEAMQMKDSGFRVSTAEEGYDVKADEVRLKLHTLGLADLPLAFFNAAEDDPDTLRSFLKARTAAVRDRHREGLREIVAGANALLANYEKEQAQEAMRTAARHLKSWLEHNAELERTSRHVHDSLIAATASAHAQTINAAIVREGNWHKLSYGHNLSHGARRMAAQAAERKLLGFQEIAIHLLRDEQLADAHDLVRQALRALGEGFDGLIRKVQLVGESIHADELSIDAEFWRDCEREWGRGVPRYRDRINARNKHWFEERHGLDADRRVCAVINEEWKNAIATVNQLMREAGEQEIAYAAV